MTLIKAIVSALMYTAALSFVTVAHAQSAVTPECKKYIALAKRSQPVPWSEFKRVLEIPSFVTDACKSASSTNVVANIEHKVGNVALSATVTPRSGTCVVTDIKISGC
jgi:hypothetical protein